MQNSPTILINKGWYMIAEQDDKIFFVKNGGWSLYIINFVLIVLLVIFGINAIIQLVGGNNILGIVLILISIIVWSIWHYNRSTINKSKDKWFQQSDLIAIVDLESVNLLDKTWQTIAELDQVEFYTTMNPFSSSPMIKAGRSTWSMVLIRGNPFAWWTRPFVGILRQKWLMK